MGVVHCYRCRKRAIAALPERPPAGWEVIFANRWFGRGGGTWEAICLPCRAFEVV